MSEELQETVETTAPAEETTEAAPVETEETEELAPDAGAEPPKSKGVQKRIDELVKQREDERRRAERLEGMLERMLQGQPKQEPEAPQVIPPTRPKPTFEACEFDQERYTEELTDWKIEQREAKARAESEQQQRERHQQTFVQTFEQKRMAVLEQGAQKYPDFQDVVMPLPLDVEFVAALLETEAPADVVYYLGKNPQEVARINQLPPLQKAAALARLEAKAAVPVPPKKTTAAPPPVNPVGHRAPVDVEPDPAKDPEGWRRWERARVQKLGRLY